MIEFNIPHPLITIGASAFGKAAKELYKSSQEAIILEVQSHPQKEEFQRLLETGTALNITVEFHLRSQRFKSDLDNLFSGLLNPLVEGACSLRPAGRPIPQNKDSLFWKATLVKVKDDSEYTLVKIQPHQTP